MAVADPAMKMHEFGELSRGKVGRRSSVHGQDDDGLHGGLFLPVRFDQDFEGLGCPFHELESEARFAQGQAVRDHVSHPDPFIS